MDDIEQRKRALLFLENEDRAISILTKILEIPIEEAEKIYIDMWEEYLSGMEEKEV